MRVLGPGPEAHLIEGCILSSKMGDYEGTPDDFRSELAMSQASDMENDFRPQNPQIHDPVTPQIPSQSTFASQAEQGTEISKKATDNQSLL
ncbi:hypothetical protein Ddc_02938 [Ditylenchus destructor]|nr:hypothetical protein Ddc_02938 [Ditylenchus destructor]